MEIITINEQEEVQNIISKLEEQDLFLNLSFIKNERYKVHAIFKSAIGLFFEVSRTITPDSLSTTERPSIFKSLKYYGESSVYHKLIDERNNVVIDGSFFKITHFFNDLYLVEGKLGKGIINVEGKVICTPEYDEITPMEEFVFGVVKNNKIGYMNLIGEIIIPLEYEYHIFYPNKFEKGKVHVEQIEKGCFRYTFDLDHYGNIVSSKHLVFNDNVDYPSPFSSEDSSIAYEGDDSNRWNTD